LHKQPEAHPPLKTASGYVADKPDRLPINNQSLDLYAH